MDPSDSNPSLPNFVFLSLSSLTVKIQPSIIHLTSQIATFVILSFSNTHTGVFFPKCISQEFKENTLEKEYDSALT